MRITSLLHPDPLKHRWAFYETPPVPTPPAPTPPAPTPPAPTPPAPAPPANEWTPPSKEQWEATQAAAATANQKLREQQTAREEAERKAAEQAGEFKSLYERERDERAREKTERDEADRKTAEDNATAERTTRLERVAEKLGAHDAKAAVRMLEPGQIQAATTDASAEAELVKLFNANAWLKKDGERQLPNGGGSEEAAGAAGGGGTPPAAVGVDRLRNHYEKQAAANQK